MGLRALGQEDVEGGGVLEELSQPALLCKVDAPAYPLVHEFGLHGVRDRRELFLGNQLGIVEALVRGASHLERVYNVLSLICLSYF